MKMKSGGLLVAVALVVGLLLSLALWRISVTKEGSPGPGMDSGSSTSRVILFAPNLIETAWVLGYGSRIVAITDYCIWPQELSKLPAVGGAVDPNLERILALRPSLLVVEGESAELTRLAAYSGISLARVNMDKDLSSIFAGFARLDSLLGSKAWPGAEELSRRVAGELEAVRKAVPWKRRPRVLLSLGHDSASLAQLWTTGSDGFLEELLEIAGGQALDSSGVSGYYGLSLERLLANPPEVVLELRPGESFDPGRRRELVRIWREAGVTAPVEVLTFDGLLIPGPRIGQTARVLQEALLRAWPKRE